MATLLDNLKKVYRINVKCKNCGEFSQLSIPKGITIDNYLIDDMSKCPMCGCNTLKRYETKKGAGQDARIL